MTDFEADRWPSYQYIVPQVYTKAKVRLVGLGNYIPDGQITNEFFAYISTKLGNPRKAADLERVTGLETRHVRSSTLALCRRMAGADAPGLIAGADAKDESLADMALTAAQRALASAGLKPNDIDVVVGASSSDNDSFPTIANLVQHGLKMPPVRATMLKGACACQTEGFQVCAEILKAGSARRVLMVTTEGLLSNIMHVLDWKTSSLFGEGATAFVIEVGSDSDPDNYFINGTDVSLGPSLSYQTPLRKDVLEMAEIDLKIHQLYQQGNGAEVTKLLSQHLVGYTKMNGKDIYREGPRAMAESLDVVMRHSGLKHEDLRYIVPHQANSRITRRVGDLLVNDYEWPSSIIERLADNFRYYGNTSNASIGTALVEVLREGKIKDGDWIALPAVGGGLNYGCWLLKYYNIKHPEAFLNPQA